MAMRNSEVSDAGIIGLYVGHYRYGASGNITVEGSTFARSRTNGVAIQGADDVILRNNQIVDNHWHGLWPVPSVPGGITTGGQMLIGQGARISVTGNRFSGVECRDCRPARHVVAIEVGEDAAAPGVQGLTISENLLCNATGGRAIAQNPGTRVTNVTMQRNRFLGFTVADDFVGAVGRAGNTFGQSGNFTRR